MTGAAKVLNRGDEDGRRDDAEQGSRPDHRINPELVRPVSHDHPSCCRITRWRRNGCGLFPRLSGKKQEKWGNGRLGGTSWGRFRARLGAKILKSTTGRLL